MILKCDDDFNVKHIKFNGDIEMTKYKHSWKCRAG